MSDSNACRTNGKPAGERTNGKPAKPYADFPLFPHATRRWAKKIRGKLHYFGAWQDWQAALDKYQAQKDDLHAGGTPRVQSDGLTVRDLLNRFLTAKKLLVDAGELAARTFADYKVVTDHLSAAFGLTRLVEDLASEDFEKLRASTAKRYGPVALGNEVQRIRTVFKYAYDVGLINKPIRPRPKTGIKRRCPLWPETVEAIREALEKRPEPKRPEYAALAFVTKYGGSWWKDKPDSPVSKEMAKLLDALDIRRGGRNFYALRHGTETIGGEARDQVALDHIMGHVRDDMASVYRERIGDERLRAVTDHIRAWLFASEEVETEASEASAEDKAEQPAGKKVAREKQSG